MKFLPMGLLLTSVLVILCTHTVSAQPTDIPANTSSPPLAVIILLDDSGTMQATGDNTISVFRQNYPGQPLPPAVATDPNGVRWRAVSHIIDLLAQDAHNQHRVAVLSFDRTNQIWLPRNEANQDAPFFTVGGGQPLSYDYARLFNGHTSGSSVGDTLSAVQIAADRLMDEIGQVTSAPYKTVMILITDDVPVSATQTNGLWNTPFSGSLPDWISYSNQFKSTLQDNIGRLPAFQGNCTHNDGRLVMATLAMGAAVWVEANGSPNDATTWRHFLTGPEDEPGSYFYALAYENNWVSFDGQPLTYAIDRFFEGEQTLRTDFTDSINSLMTELRCGAGEYLVGSEITTEQRRFDVNVSAMYRQFRLVFDMPPGLTATFTPPGGMPQTVTGGAIGVRGFQRTDFSSGWAGTWPVTVSGSQPGRARVYLDADVDLSGLSWNIRGTNGEYRTNETNVVDIELVSQYEGQELRVRPNDVLVDQLNVSYRQNVVAVEAGTEYFQINLNEDTPGTYELIVSLHLSRLIGGLNNDQSLSLAPKLLDFQSSEPDIQLLLPADNSMLDCLSSERQGHAWVRVLIQLPDSDNLLPENLLSYTSVVMNYLAGDDESSSEPVVLGWDGEGNIVEGWIPCDMLAEGMVPFNVEVRFPDGKRQSKDYRFLFQPTPTFTPTATATGTPIPVFTPTAMPTATPTGPDYRKETMDALQTRPFPELLFIVVVGTALWVILRAFQWVRRTFMPLTFVWQMNAKKQRVARWYFPFRQSKNVDGLFRLKYNRRNNELVIEPLGSLKIDDKPVSPGRDQIINAKETSIISVETGTEYRYINLLTRDRR